MPPGFQKVRAYRIYSPHTQSVVELIDPDVEKLKRVRQQLGGAQASVSSGTVGVKWISGSVNKAAPARRMSSAAIVKALDKMISYLEDPADAIVKALEGELIWEQELKATCRGFNRNGEAVVECDGWDDA
jgi:hypothetical protein